MDFEHCTGFFRIVKKQSFQDKRWNNSRELHMCLIPWQSQSYGLLPCALSLSYLQHIYCTTEYTQQEEISLNYVEYFNMYQIIQYLEHY